MSNNNKVLTQSHQQATLDLSIALLERPSVTPDDNGCQDILSERLEQAGFDCEFMYYGDRQAKANMLRLKIYGRAVVPPIRSFALQVILTSSQQAMKKTGLIRHLPQPLQMAIYGRAVRLI